MQPGQPQNAVVTAAVLSPPSVSLEWDTAVDAVYYMVYRSTAPLLLGAKINNVNVAPGVTKTTYVDNAANSLSAPVAGTTYFYRIVAMGSPTDGISLPSSGVQATIQGSAVVHDTIQGAIVTAMLADPDLMALLNGVTTAVRWHHLTREQGDTFPFVVAWRTGWSEDRRFKDARHGNLVYTFAIYSNQPSYKPTTDVAHRIIKIFEGLQGRQKLKNAGATILSNMFLEGGPEMFDEGISLWFQERKLILTVIFNES